MFAIYCIECYTPNHLYIGQTAHLIKRIENHIAGAGEGHAFTKSHGVKTWCVVGFHDTRQEAVAYEQQEYYRLKNLGYVVGGFAFLERPKRPDYRDRYAADPLIIVALEDKALISLSSKAKWLAMKSNCSEAAAKSRLRRALKLIP